MLGETSSKKQQMNTGVRRGNTLLLTQTNRHWDRQQMNAGVRRGNTLLLTQTNRRWDRQQMDVDGQAGVRRDKFKETTDEYRR